MDFSEALPRTGFPQLDQNASQPKRAPRALHGYTMLKSPVAAPPADRVTPYPMAQLGFGPTGYGAPLQLRFNDLEKAYEVDSYIRQGIDKYVELITKHGWRLDAETPEPTQYVEGRFRLMGIMTGKPWAVLIDEIVLDFCKFGNAFLVKKRAPVPEEVPGLPQSGIAGRKLPVLGYYRVDPKRLRPVYSQDNKQLLAWEYLPPSPYGVTVDGNLIRFPRSEVIHLAYNVQAGNLWGSPWLQPVLDDVREYRRCEEYVIKLLYKHLHPLMHHEVPDTTGTGQGRQEDVDAADAAHTVIAPDGMIITPPGHKLNVVGAESHALRGEGYMQLLRQRVYAGLGVNQVVMGEGESTTAGSADAMTITMHNRAKLIQRQLGEWLTEFILTELLMEGGFDPLAPLDYTQWIWNDIETEAKIAQENHEIQKWTNGLTTHDEARRRIGHKPLPEDQEHRLYPNMIQVPVIDAAADAKARTDSTTAGAGPKAAVGSKANPSNQHGKRGAPKIRPR